MGNDVPKILDTMLRSCGLARAGSRSNANASQQAKLVCVSKCPQ